MAAVLTAITEALMDMSGGFYLPSNGDMLAHDVNFSSASADKGFFLKVLKNLLYLNSPHLAGSYRVSSRTPSRVRKLDLNPSTGSFSNLGTYLNDGATGSVALGLVELPHGQTLTSFSMFIDPGAHATDLPGTFPYWELYAKAVATGSDTLVATKTDAPASLAAYNAYHAIEKTAISHLIDCDANAYYVRFEGESGANDEIGLKVYRYVDFTVTRTTVGED